MDLVGAYGDSDSDHEDEKIPIPTSSMTINATPHVDTDINQHPYVVDTKITSLIHNPTVEQMWAPVQGPYNPFQRDVPLAAQQLGIVKNAVTGYVEPFHMNDATFQENYNQFGAKGYAYDPSATLNPHNPEAHVIGDIEKYRSRNAPRPPRETPRESKAERRKRKLDEDPNDVDAFATKGPWAQRVEIELQEELTEEQKAIVAADALRKRKKPQDQKTREDGEGTETTKDDWRDPDAKKFAQSAEESTIFHGTAEHDYQGRTYMDPPSNLKIQTPSKTFIPKKHIHTWSGHSKGVNKISFFPQTGHLLLSASNDKTIKIWDVAGNKHCLRTYLGHGEAVRDISWGIDGRTFVSVSYDRWVKVWDTETGKVISRHTSGKNPVCCKIHPDADKQNDILVGQNNKKIVQWDTRANTISQEYDEHLGPVNSVTFIDGNRRFVSTADDKKVLVWEYGLPVVIKHISEPDMHSIPVIAVHPSQKWFVGQSQDNQILCFTALNRYKLNRKKRFIGHLTAGYAAGINFSPDGRYIMSGDAEGRVFFWEWKSQKIFSKLKAHDQVAIGCEWHPLETSKVATCSWDGTIKYWD